MTKLLEFEKIDDILQSEVKIRRNEFKQNRVLLLPEAHKLVAASDNLDLMVHFFHCVTLHSYNSDLVDILSGAIINSMLNQDKAAFVCKTIYYYGQYILHFFKECTNQKMLETVTDFISSVMVFTESQESEILIQFLITSLEKQLTEKNLTVISLLCKMIESYLQNKKDNIMKMYSSGNAVYNFLVAFYTECAQSQLIFLVDFSSLFRILALYSNCLSAQNKYVLNEMRNLALQSSLHIQAYNELMNAINK